ncbi:MAG: DsbA family oxidoreductase [Gemmatimonadota bacterium]
MQVEVWADIICPWCGLGLHRLGTALAQFPHAGDVEVVHRSFQLDPSFPEGTVMPSLDMLRRKGLDEAQITGSQRRIEEMAASEGLTPYHVAGSQVGNTSLAHELLAYATASGRHTEAWQGMFRAYFGEQRPVFDVPSLVSLAGELGLDPAGAQEALASRRYAGQVEADAREAARLGATGVPFFVLGRRYGVSGAQPPGVMLEALQQAWSATHPPDPVPGAAS